MQAYFISSVTNQHKQWQILSVWCEHFVKQGLKASQSFVYRELDGRVIIAGVKFGFFMMFGCVGVCVFDVSSLTSCDLSQVETASVKSCRSCDKFFHSSC